MATLLSMVRDINGYNTFGLPCPDRTEIIMLLGGIEKNFVVPSTGDATYSNWLAVFEFQPGASIWVARNATAEIPGASFTSSVSELNPSARKVFEGDTLSFISSDAVNQMGVAFYAIA